jgi:endonuclease/exonuclease/phosphatase family metal-dependent hydrolase
MLALLYKIQQLLSCQQTCYHYCLSNHGPFIITNGKNIYKCGPIFDKIQRHIGVVKIKTVMSWNIQELFWHCYGGNKISNIIKYLISASKCDVICLQEVFELSAINSIIDNRHIQKNFPFFLTGTMRNSFLVGENSGLLILSKYPIKFKQFVPFHKSAWPDILASKGALYFSVGNTNFITTHLQSGNYGIASEQLHNILNQTPFLSKTILLGDLNIENHQSITNTFRNNTNYTHESKQVLDHVISINNDIKLDVNIDYFEMNRCSDHYPIIANLKN